MAQHDYIINNQTFPATRADVNSAFGAVATNNSGATAPVVKYEYMWWPDTSTDTLKMLNATKTAWIEFANIDTTNDRFEMLTNVVQAVSTAGVTLKNLAGSDILLVSDTGDIATNNDVTGLWRFEEFLKVFNNAAIADMKQWRFETSADGNFHIKTIDDAGVSKGALLNVSQDASGPVQISFLTQGNTRFRIADDHVKINALKVWGKYVTIANDAVGVIVPPRNGGMCSMICAPEGTTSRAGYSDEFFYHANTSPFSESIVSATSVGIDVNHVTGFLVGTTGAGTKVTISPQADGSIQIENRSGASRSFEFFMR